MLSAFVRKTLPVLFLLFFFYPAFSQQLSNTLLWRISGNGLAQPSYLFGTMHLQDKRLFNFGDSVYNAIQKTEGFATEIDFREFFDSMMTYMTQKAEREMVLSASKVHLDRKKISPSADSILKKFGIKGGSLSKKDLKTIRDKRMQKLMQKGEMPTIVDGFLLGLALRQDKWTGGIEDVADQMSLLDELGGDLQPESVLQPDAVFEQGIEEMVKTYASQDLARIDRMLNGYSAKDKDLVLVQRNIKMARRMDSLSALRTMFFAVGAAHLPGDSGVISLLRSRGFAVEPVFSQTTTPGSEYATHLKKASWQEIKGDEGIYTVLMPSRPSLMNMYGDALKMKMCFDLTTMTMYMIGSTTGYNAKAKSLDDVMKEMVHRSAGEGATFTQSAVTQAGLQGKEAFYTSKDGHYRVQLFAQDNTIFFLMAGGPKSEQLTSNDANYFFTSFKPGNTVVKHEWKEFSLAAKGFSIRMPGTPTVNAAIDNNIPESSPWRLTSYQTIDPQTGSYYLAQIRELKEGHYLNPDSTVLEALKEDYKTRMDELSDVQFATREGYPVLYMTAYLKKVDGQYKIMCLLRHNRLYMIMGGASKGSNMNDIDSFFHSFTLFPYEATTWVPTHNAGFETMAPTPLAEMKPDSASAAKQYTAHFVSKAAADGTLYEVFKDIMPPLYWIENDSAFYYGKLAQYRMEGDSLLQHENVMAGSLKGLDFTLSAPGYTGNKRLRLLMNGDTLYTIYAMLPTGEADSNHDLFFSRFHVLNEKSPTIYTSKAAALLEALTTKDSAQFSSASETFDLVSFTKADVPLLHKALLRTYYDSIDYRNANDKIADQLRSLADSSTLGFVEKEYPVAKDGGHTNFSMLTMLAKWKTAGSYALLKRVLAKALPTSGLANSLRNALEDSLLLTKTLFPEMLLHVDDSLLSQTVIALTNQLLDTGMLTREMVLPYEKTILSHTRKTLATVNGNKNEEWQLYEHTKLLGWLNTKESNDLLYQILLQKDVYLKQGVIMALLKNNLSVPPAEAAKVATDREQRIYFYQALQKEHKESVFPALYASQKSLAESEAYNLFTEDYEDDFTLAYVGERTAEYKGVRSLFYLFKVRLAYEDDVKKDYLVITGPYTPGAKEKILFSNATGYYTDETFLPQRTDKLLKAYLLSLTPAEK